MPADPDPPEPCDCTQVEPLHHQSALGLFMSCHRLLALPLVLLFGVVATAGAQHATVVVEHVPGEGVGPGYGNPATTLGPPTRMSGLPGITDSVVTPFQPAYMASELLTIGRGGRLVVAFDQPILDDPDNPFGVDLLIFGNAFFTNVGSPLACTGALYDEGGRIEVSADGIHFIQLPNRSADGGFPTLGYRDVEPFATNPGAQPTDFTHPVDPALMDLMLESAVCWDELLIAYDGSGGGTPIDLATVGLAQATHIRITVDAEAGSLPEIDGFADVAPRPRGDLDGNGTINGADLTLVLAAWGTPDHPADLDGNGVVDGPDLTIILGGWD